MASGSSGVSLAIGILLDPAASSCESLSVIRRILHTCFWKPSGLRDVGCGSFSIRCPDTRSNPCHGTSKKSKAWALPEGLLLRFSGAFALFRLGRGPQTSEAPKVRGLQSSQLRSPKSSRGLREPVRSGVRIFCTLSSYLGARSVHEWISRRTYCAYDLPRSTKQRTEKATSSSRVLKT